MAESGLKQITNFKTSWTDGTAFCAIINRYRPDILNYADVNPGDARGNLERAFAAAQSLGIDRLLDAEDLVGNAAPDDKSIVAYVLEFYKLFIQG